MTKDRNRDQWGKSHREKMSSEVGNINRKRVSLKKLDQSWRNKKYRMEKLVNFLSVLIYLVIQGPRNNVRSVRYHRKDPIQLNCFADKETKVLSGLHCAGESKPPPCPGSS